jgi:hypothetical protein
MRSATWLYAGKTFSAAMTATAQNPTDLDDVITFLLVGSGGSVEPPAIS